MAQDITAGHNDRCLCADQHTFARLAAANAATEGANSYDTNLGKHIMRSCISLTRNCTHNNVMQSHSLMTTHYGDAAPTSLCMEYLFWAERVASHHHWFMENHATAINQSFGAVSLAIQTIPLCMCVLKCLNQTRYHTTISQNCYVVGQFSNAIPAYHVQISAQSLPPFPFVTW